MRKLSTGAIERPAVVWDRSAKSETTKADAATAPTTVESALPSRRARRIATGAQPVISEQALGEDVALVEDVAPDTAEVPVAPVVLEAAPEALDAAPENVAPALEPESEPTVEAEPAEASDTDAFEAAARLFSFTGEIAAQKTATEAPAPAAAAPAASAAHHARRSARGAAFRRVATMSFSFGVMGIVGLLAVSLTTPVGAVAAMGSAEPVSMLAPAETVTEEDDAAIQAYVAPATIENEVLDRTGSYDTVTYAELAADSGISNMSNLFVNDPNAAIQWPFAVGVPMSYGFGMRSGRMHEGIDFTPGEGAPVQAITEGTVRVASEAGGAYGVHVIIDHEVDGQLISSHYAHMQYGSLQVAVGQKVEVGTVVGRTGNTGRSFGAHTHFELLLNGTTAIDPLPWLREHAGG
jgi:murein DD-endopeptidase MepM/ murein hydrolase activator NlpD